MRLRHIALSVAVSLLFAFSSSASVTDANYADDGDGALVCPVYSSTGPTDTLYLDGVLNWGPGHVIGQIYTDTPEDPTITMDNSLDNDTTFAWSAFQVNVRLNHTFSILTTPYPNVYNPNDWSANILTQPVPIGGGIYQGSIKFTSGTPVNVGQTLEFLYKINFSGLTSYSFVQEFIPIPEPGTASLLLGGALILGLAGKRR